jgi:hypothetical protein
MLAPEELLKPATQSSLIARSEQTPEEAQRIRERKRKANKADRKHLGGMADLYGKGNKKGGTKGENVLCKVLSRVGKVLQLLAKVIKSWVKVERGMGMIRPERMVRD